MQILYVGSDFCSTKTLTSVLPKHLLECGAKVDIIVPHFYGIDEGESPLALRLISASVQIDGRDEKVKVYEGRRDTHIRTFYLDSDILSKRLCLAEDQGILACAVFAHAVCQFIEQVSTHYDVVFCDGIRTALVPVLMRTVYASSAKIASLKIAQGLSGIANKGTIDMNYIRRLHLPSELASSEQMEFYGKLSLLKGAYIFVDSLIFPNRDVEELIKNNRGKDIGMEGVLFSKAAKLHNITIGIDKARIHAVDAADKAALKADFVKAHHLNGDAKRALVSFIGMLNDKSGIDLVNDILDDLMDRRINLVICGDGNEKYMDAVESWTQEFKGSVCYISKHPKCEDIKGILEASDILLCPSAIDTIDTLALKAQNASCIPVVRIQGASKTTLRNVKDLKAISDTDNAFTFANYDSDDFFNASMDALDLYARKDVFKQLQKQAVDAVPAISDTAKQLFDILNHI